MRFLFPIAIFFFALQSSAQIWPGYETGNFAGVHQVKLQPASIAGGPYKADINILSSGVTLYGDALVPNYNVLEGFNTSKITDYAKLLEVRANDLTLVSNTLLPSFSYDINGKSAIAFTSGIKAVSINKTSALTLKDILRDALDAELADKAYTNEFVRSYFLSWTSFNFTYSRILYESDNHRLKSGLTAKWLQGLGSLSVELGEMDFKLQGDSSLSYLNLNATYVYDKKIGDLLDGDGLDFLGNFGYALDFGVEYEFGRSPKPGHSYADYVLKLGFTAADMGSIGFKAAEQRDFSASIENVSLSTFQGIGSLEEFKDTFDRVFNLDDVEDPGRYRVRVPMQLSWQLDYNLGRNFYMNLVMLLNINKLGFNNIDLPNSYRFRFTPRYEDHAYGVYLPIESTGGGLINAGLALRWKAFVIGSNNIFSRWFYADDNVVGDIYVGIKAPLLKNEYQGKRPVKGRLESKREVKEE
ncbi:MAG: hypothetical protein GY751_08295 [Bacteroidetes bacterium]|nr:hypothetical protein [Bacteroidota bacterium]